jgi:hypothetical protein
MKIPGGFSVVYHSLEAPSIKPQTWLNWQQQVSGVTNPIYGADMLDANTGCLFRPYGTDLLLTRLQMEATHGFTKFKFWS